MGGAASMQVAGAGDGFEKCARRAGAGLHWLRCGGDDDDGRRKKTNVVKH
jgi:hypothetical protein